ncbi:unnamed protein product [Haemonchus placei]|uniref:Small conductance calcium-activated potassium channel protein n=1 Tax=Haemonchus placei TaxID=6290 RepID=A0A0N4X5G9_HAEPC|nr:unnamed protein product [Haemonchus placei]
MPSQEGPSTAPEQPATSNGIGGAGPNGDTQQGNGVLPNSSSTVEKFPLINRLFRRRNRVHNAYEAQSEFMQKFGHGGSDASAAAATTATATEPRPPPEGVFILFLSVLFAFILSR